MQYISVQYCHNLWYENRKWDFPLWQYWTLQHLQLGSYELNLECWDHSLLREYIKSASINIEVVLLTETLT